MATEFQKRVFAEALQEALGELGMSGRALARAAGVSASAASQWIRGRSVPGADMTAKLEQILQLEEGALGRLIGYIPASVQDQALRSVVGAIRSDPRLGDRERRLLETMYRELVRQRAREQKARGAADGSP